MSMREQIRKSQRLTRMRLGQQVFEWFEFESIVADDGSKYRVAMVTLNEAEVQRSVFYAAELDVADNMIGTVLRDRAAKQHDVWLSLREPDDIETLVFESVVEMVETLESNDIDRAVTQLSLLMDYASPVLDNISAEDLNDLKKAFAATEWSALTGPQWAAVKLCCQQLLPDLLQAKLSGSTSTESSTERNGAEEPT